MLLSIHPLQTLPTLSGVSGEKCNPFSLQLNALLNRCVSISIVASRSVHWSCRLVRVGHHGQSSKTSRPTAIGWTQWHLHASGRCNVIALTITALSIEQIVYDSSRALPSKYRTWPAREVISLLSLPAEHYRPPSSSRHWIDFHF